MTDYTGRKSKAKPFAILIHVDSMFTLYFSVILSVVFGYSLWYSWKFVENAIFSGKLEQQYAKFGEYNLRDQVSIILTSLGFFVPFCLAGGILYL